MCYDGRRGHGAANPEPTRAPTDDGIDSDGIDSVGSAQPLSGIDSDGSAQPQSLTLEAEDDEEEEDESNASRGSRPARSVLF